MKVDSVCFISLIDDEQKAESDIEGENSNDGEEAAVGALESLALGHHHQHMKGRGMPLHLPQISACTS